MARLALLALALVGFGCDTVGTDLDPLTPEYIDLGALSQDPAALVGTWDWVASVGRLAGEQPATPASTGDTETWTFRADGTATRIRNGEIVLATTYRVEPRTDGHGTPSPRPSLQFGTGGYGEDFGTAGDVLVLDSTPVDGPQARYRRRK